MKDRCRAIDGMTSFTITEVVAGNSRAFTVDLLICEHR